MSPIGCILIVFLYVMFYLYVKLCKKLFKCHLVMLASTSDNPQDERPEKEKGDPVNAFVQELVIDEFSLQLFTCENDVQVSITDRFD